MSEEGGQAWQFPSSPVQGISVILIFYDQEFILVNSPHYFLHPYREKTQMIQQEWFRETKLLMCLRVRQLKGQWYIRKLSKQEMLVVWKNALLK